MEAGLPGDEKGSRASGVYGREEFKSGRLLLGEKVGKRKIKNRRLFNGCCRGVHLLSFVYISKPNNRNYPTENVVRLLLFPEHLRISFSQTTDSELCVCVCVIIIINTPAGWVHTSCDNHGGQRWILSDLSSRHCDANCRQGGEAAKRPLCFSTTWRALHHQQMWIGGGQRTFTPHVTG